MICEWILNFPEGATIQLTFVEFDLEYAHNCVYDRLEVRDGRTSSSPLIGSYFCGIVAPRTTITSNGNHLYVKFSSDGSVTRTGFSIEVDSGISL